MKTLLILGAGTAGTMVANKMAAHLDPESWRVVIVDREETHYYQPGFLFIPFGIYSGPDVVKPKREFLPRSVQVIISDIERIEPEHSRVQLKKDGKVLHYDILVIATGAQIRPEQVDGMVNGGWQKNIFDFYTLDGATKLARFLKTWEGGAPGPQRGRNADQMPGRATGVRFPGRLVLQRKGHSR